MLLLLAACYIPTTYGLRDDGLLPTGPEVSAHVTQSGTFLTEDAALSWYGAQGRFRLSPNIGLRVSGSVLPSFGSSSELLVGGAEADVLVGFAREPEHVLTGTVSFGMSALIASNSDRDLLVVPGFDAGVTVSRTVARTLHPFVGVRVNPVGSAYGDGDGVAVWVHTGGGLSWRPPIGKGEGLLLVQGGWDHGFTPCFHATGEGMLEDACNTWTVGLSAGATFGPKAAE